MSPSSRPELGADGSLEQWGPLSPVLAPILSRSCRGRRGSFAVQQLVTVLSGPTSLALAT